MDFGRVVLTTIQYIPSNWCGSRDGFIMELRWYFNIYCFLKIKPITDLK